MSLFVTGLWRLQHVACSREWYVLATYARWMDDHNAWTSEHGLGWECTGNAAFLNFASQLFCVVETLSLLDLENRTFLDGSLIIASVSILFCILIVPQAVRCCEGWYQKCVICNFCRESKLLFLGDKLQKKLVLDSKVLCDNYLDPSDGTFLSSCLGCWSLCLTTSVSEHLDHLLRPERHH